MCLRVVGGGGEHQQLCLLRLPLAMPRPPLVLLLPPPVALLLVLVLCEHVDVCSSLCVLVCEFARARVGAGPLARLEPVGTRWQLFRMLCFVVYSWPHRRQHARLRLPADAYVANMPIIQASILLLAI